MKILLLASDAYGGHGGIALFNRELCAALAAHEVTVLPRVMQHEPENVPQHVTFLAEAAGGNLPYARAVAGLRRQRFDLVICGHINLLPAACALARAPLLVAHGIEAWQPPRGALARRLVQRCRGVVAVSGVTRDRFVEWSGFRGATYVLPNAVHLEQYGIRPRRDDLAERYGVAGKRVLLTVGRLDADERSKGFDQVIAVLPELPDDVVYLIAGGGADASRLQQLAFDGGVARRVFFTGLFAERDKPDLYNLADVYVMPSRGEGFGFVFLEALACGLPVIGSSIDGGREALLGGELGTLVEPSDRDALRAAIVAALQQPRAIPPRLSYFSFENFAARANEVIRSAAAT
ncbi:MAG TPA: glycosyltransferase family 4 protein [Thermoanaerobaculia bacterium]